MFIPISVVLNDTAQAARYPVDFRRSIKFRCKERES
jgi:hypothetical protein